MVGVALFLVGALMGQPLAAPEPEAPFCSFGDAHAGGDGELCQPDVAEPTDAPATEPPTHAVVSPTQRTAEQAERDVCLYAQPADRPASCTTLLQAEAALVPDSAFNTDAMGWADQACPSDQFAAAARSECRREQRDRFRRADRARQALGGGALGGVYAEGSGYTVGPAGSSTSDEALGFSESRRQLADNCEQRAAARRDQDSGDQSSSYSVTCRFGSDDPAARERLDEIRDRMFGD